ncbi:unnamed protein product [Kuraishia capsulata CBS 1993]|uniref:Chitin synthase export chaperone n=1 Tax=Kuraishia capsulata CBS 1993 TaxID=1382522 RepID=W6MN86_9ASCO|nr:uncharacterized protein KUCA_T00003707001 [Kuraishia capsulata CBS 1993]CDK27728.1 unnamed protein product [Kuraishia capsulata CBS 1993]
MGFGDFSFICAKAPLPVCSVVRAAGVNATDTVYKGILPSCYARPVNLANTMVFEIGNAFVNIAALVIMLIILFQVKSKYTAIGRSEMVFFFSVFIGLIVSTLIVDCGVSPPGSGSYGYFVAIQLGMVTASCWSLAYSGMTGYQLWEDGTRFSMKVLRISSLGAFVMSFLVAIFTFENWSSGVDTEHTMGLFVVCYIVNGILVVTYLVSQAVLSVFYLNNWWAFGALCLGGFFFVCSQLLVYAFSTKICENVNHYIDGLLFGSLCNLSTVMMVYKYWDMITTEDLEFAVTVGGDTGMGWGNYTDKDESLNLLNDSNN